MGGEGSVLEDDVIRGLHGVTSVVQLDEGELLGLSRMFGKSISHRSYGKEILSSLLLIPALGPAFQGLKVGVFRGRPACSVAVPTLGLGGLPIDAGRVLFVG